MARRLTAWATGLFLITASTLALTSACGSDDSGGGGNTGGADSGTDGTSTGGTGGATGGTGGTSTTGGTGGTTTDGGCDPAPDPGEVDACGTCQDDTHAYCVCDSAVNDCLLDDDCSNIWDCTFDGIDGGIGPCLDLDAAGAACVHSCIALYPNGKALYLALEKCIYCQYCGQACDSGEYCTALDNPPDAGSDASTDATSDATTDAANDAASDATSDATSDAANDAVSDAANDAASDAAGD